MTLLCSEDLPLSLITLYFLARIFQATWLATPISTCIVAQSTWMILGTYTRGVCFPMLVASDADIALSAIHITIHVSIGVILL